MEASETKHTASPASETEDEEPADIQPPLTPPVEPKAEPETEPELADWFRVENSDADKGKGKARETPPADAESETEPESDNEDVRDENAGIDDAVDELDDDWFEVPSQGTVSVVTYGRSMLADTKTKVDVDVTSGTAAQAHVLAQMGETDEAMEYDQDLIFRHLCVRLVDGHNAS